MPSADFCAAMWLPLGFLSPVSETRRRSPEVSLTAFTAHLPDLQLGPLMDMDFAGSCPLVRPGLPNTRFLFVRSRLCSTLPSDPASRRRPCVLANTSPPSGCVGDFHPQAVKHARHTTKPLRGRTIRRSGGSSSLAELALSVRSSVVGSASRRVRVLAGHRRVSNDSFVRRAVSPRSEALPYPTKGVTQ